MPADSAKTKGSLKKTGRSSKASESVSKPIPEIWSEWVDSEINSQKWGTPILPPVIEKPGKGKGKDKKEKKSDKGSGKSGKSGKTGKTDKTGKSNAPAVVEKYEDPFEVPLPYSLKTEVKWVRPETLLQPDRYLVSYSPSSSYVPDLVTKNHHLLHSPFIRAIVSAVHMLTYLGQTSPFVVEWQTGTFQANTEGTPWQPWHHVYSLCKAGKGQNHNPVANSLGKYVVRLYWMGCWRKFMIDDLCPVDSRGTMLLPITVVPNDKEFELWPILLTKALMKIASLTWTQEKDLVDFDIVTCLTGWTVQKIFTTGMDLQDIWEICCGYSDHYTWDNRLVLTPDDPVEIPNTKSSAPPSTKGSGKSKSKDKSGSKGSKKGSKGSKKGGAEPPPFVTPFHLAVTCRDLRFLCEDFIEDITPCYEHTFLVEETRNIPIVEFIPDYDRNIARWKYYRWIDWAVAHGIWHKVEEWELFKCIHLVSSLRKIDHNVVFERTTTEREKLIKHSVYVIKEFLERKMAERKLMWKRRPGSAPASTKGSEKGSKKGKKDSKKGKEKPVPRPPFEDPSIWGDFAKIAQYVTCISIYLKPSSFKVKYVISNFPFGFLSDAKGKKGGKKEDKKKGGDEPPKYIFWDSALQKTKNDALYLFTDSLDVKLIMFTLTHLGNDLPKVIVKPEDAFKIICKKLVCKNKKCLEECICQKIPSLEKIEEKYEDTRKTVNLMVENFEWLSNEIGEISINLRTYGLSSVLFNLEAGRHTKKIWMDTITPYSLVILSDTPLKIGKLDEILDCMTAESDRVMQACFDICSAFGKLLRYLGFPEYAKSKLEFHQSYMPQINLSKNQESLIHDCFKAELINVLQRIFPPEKHYDISRAFRILLLDPNFRIPREVQIKPYVQPEEEGDPNCFCDDIDRMKLEEISAIKIQAFFKMIYIQKLKMLHNPIHKKFQPAMDLLKAVYVNIFSNKQRLMNLDLLRSLLINKDIQPLVKYFLYYKDLSRVIHLRSFSGEIPEVAENSWVPLVRRIIYYQHSDSSYIRVYLFCSLQDYVLRIINNDTGKEIQRYINTPVVQIYETNESGYTVLGYGWSKEVENLPKPITWKLYILIEKKLNSCPVEIDNVNNKIYNLRGNYIPNKNNLICKISIKVFQSGFGTFYFKPSYPAMLKLQCSNKNNEIIFETTGQSFILVPVVNLFKKDDTSQSIRSIRGSSFAEIRSKTRLSKKSSSLKSRASSKQTDRRKTGTSKQISSLSISQKDFYTEYFVEVFVLESSWPLAPREWEVVEKLMKRNLIENELELQLNPPTKTSKKSLLKSSLHLNPNEEKPYWIITNLMDEDINIIIEIDENRFEEIRRAKRELYEDNIQRFAESKRLRQEFLEENYLQFSESTIQSIDYDLSDDAENVSSKYRKSTVSEPPVELTLQPRVSRHKMLPLFTINEYDMDKDQNRWVILPVDQDKIFNDIEENVELFENYYNTFIEASEYYNERKQAVTEYLCKWFGKIREESTDMMKECIARRDRLIAKMKEAEPKVEKAKGKDKKKKK